MDDSFSKRVPMYDDFNLKILEKDTEIAELELKNQVLEVKLKKVQTKKENVEEELQELKNELCHTRIELLNCGRSEKNLAMTLLFSWIMFGVLALLMR